MKKTAKATAPAAALEEGIPEFLKRSPAPKMLRVVPAKAANGGSVLLATADHDLGLVSSKTATKAAQAAANKEGKPVTMRDPTTDKVLVKVMPQSGSKAPKTAKAAKPAKPAKPNGDRKPSGMVVKILHLASRKNGVTPAELNEMTKWKGAPWKWLFSNPKGNGYCDRWNYKFSVERGEDGTRYFAAAK